MLVLTRRIAEEIVLPDSDVTIAVLSVAGKKVKLGVTAPAGVPVHRREVLQRAGRTDRRTCEDPAVRGSDAAPARRDRGSRIYD
jgi:carbon storage regulator